MADISITAGNVLPAEGAVLVDGTLGETVTAGQVVRLDSGTSTYLVADKNTEDAAEATGIAMNGGSAGQPVKVAIAGKVDIGSASVITGNTYALSSDGAIAPIADTVAEFLTIIGVCDDDVAQTLDLIMYKSGVQVS